MYKDHILFIRDVKVNVNKTHGTPNMMQSIVSKQLAKQTFI